MFMVYGQSIIKQILVQTLSDKETQVRFDKLIYRGSISVFMGWGPVWKKMVTLNIARFVRRSLIIISLLTKN